MTNLTAEMKEVMMDFIRDIPRFDIKREELWDYIEALLRKAREEGYAEGNKDGLEGRVFSSVTLDEEIQIPEKIVNHIKQLAVDEYKASFSPILRINANIERYKKAVSELVNMGQKPTLAKIANLMGLKSRASAIYYKKLLEDKSELEKLRTLDKLTTKPE